MTKEVAKRKTASEVSKEDQSDADYYRAQGWVGMGLEDVTPDQLQIPLVRLLQDNSDQVKPSSSEFIEGAKPGDLCIKDMGEYFQSMLFVPCFYHKRWFEWRPKATGGGIVAMHDTDACLEGCVQGPQNKPVNKDGNEIIETAEWFGFRYVGHNQGFMETYIPMTSTKLKVSRRWLTISANQRMSPTEKWPTFAFVYELGSAQETNPKGTYFNFTIRKVSSTREFLAEHNQNPDYEKLFADSAAKWRANAHRVVREQEGGGEREDKDGEAF